MATILVLHGPNLNLLGQREPHLYGSDSLATIDQRLVATAKKLGHELSCRQSQAEAELITYLHNAVTEGVQFVLANFAAYSHSSIALRDAILAVQLPFIEVHLSNIHAREPFRQRSLVADLAVGCISGFGAQSYSLALTAADHYLNSLH